MFAVHILCCSMWQCRVHFCASSMCGVMFGMCCSRTRINQAVIRKPRANVGVGGWVAGWVRGGMLGGVVGGHRKS